MFWGILKVIAFAGIRSPVAAEGAMSHRRENTQQRRLSLPPRGTGTQGDRHQQCSNAFDLSVWCEPSHGERPASCAIAQLRCVTRKSLPGSAVEPSAAPHAELVDAHGLLASLVWRRVGRPNPSGADTGPRRASRSDLESPRKRRSVRPMTTAQTASAEPSPASIETLFSHLARRRLGSLAAKEKQA